MSKSPSDQVIVRPKKNIPLVIAMVLGLAYALYSIWYWFGGGATAQASSDSAASLGAAIATVLVIPHLVLTFIAVIFNVLGVTMNKAGFALVAGILYAVAMVLFFTYFMYVIVQMVLCFVAFAQMRSARRAAAEH